VDFWQDRPQLVSLYHETNHRLFFSALLPSAEQDCERYFCLGEAFALALDVALADELGSDFSRTLYACGIVGCSEPSVFAARAIRRRDYLESLVLIGEAFYWRLRGQSLQSIPGRKQVVRTIAGLSSQFVDVTSPAWLRRHSRKAIPRFNGPEPKRISMEDDAQIIYRQLRRLIIRFYRGFFLSR
jgi:hypothetical protein